MWCNWSSHWLRGHVPCHRHGQRLWQRCLLSHLEWRCRFHIDKAVSRHGGNCWSGHRCNVGCCSLCRRRGLSQLRGGHFFIDDDNLLLSQSVGSHLLRLIIILKSHDLPGCRASCLTLGHPDHLLVGLLLRKETSPLLAEAQIF